MDEQELFDAFKISQRIVYGIAAAPITANDLRIKIAEHTPIRYEERPTFFFGIGVVTDPDIKEGVWWVFKDKDLWNAYLRHLNQRQDNRT